MYWQMTLIKFSFLPTSSSKKSPQELILASKLRRYGLIERCIHFARTDNAWSAPSGMAVTVNKCQPISGDVLEIGVQWSVLKKDIPSFERYMAQLKPYYLDYRCGVQSCSSI